MERCTLNDETLDCRLTKLLGLVNVNLQFEDEEMVQYNKYNCQFFYTHIFHTLRIMRWRNCCPSYHSGPLVIPDNRPIGRGDNHSFPSIFHVPLVSMSVRIAKPACFRSSVTFFTASLNGMFSLLLKSSSLCSVLMILCGTEGVRSQLSYRTFFLRVMIAGRTASRSQFSPILL